MNLPHRLKKIILRLKSHKISRHNLNRGFRQYYLEVFKLEIIRRIRLKRQRKKMRIVSVNIESISSCNRSCDFCFNHPRFESRPQGIMERDVWGSIMTQLSDLKFCGRIGPHFYNEPLLDKRLPELIAIARQKMPWAWIQINSNGDLMNEELFLELLSAGVNFFFITNYDDDEKQLLESLQKKYPAHILVVRNSDRKRTDRGGEIFGKNLILDSPCLRPGAQLVINWQAEMLLCCMDFYARYSFGNLRSDSLKALISSRKFKTLTKKLSQTRQNGPDICHKCDDPGKIPW